MVFKRLNLILLSVFFILFLSSVYSSDRACPSFALFSTNGDLVKLSSELNKKGDILLVFFASYCAPCRVEIPELVKLNEKYKNFNMMFVNIDKEGKPAAEQFLKELNVTGYRCLLDIYQHVLKRYSPALTIPAFFYIDKSGKIKFESIGYSSETMKSFEKFLIKTNK